MAITKSFDASAQASATSITFKQLNLETSPAYRPEVIGVLAQYQDGKTGVFTDNTPRLAAGTQEEAFAMFGASPLYYAATKLFPNSGDGAKCDVYYVPVPPADGAITAEWDLTVTGTATKTITAQVTYEEINVASAADAVGKIATNAQANPARAPRGTTLDGFNTYGVNVVIPKTATATEIGDLIVAAVNAEPYFPATAANVTGVVTFTTKWSGASGNIEFGLLDDTGDEILAGDYGFSVAGATGATGADATDVQDALDNMIETYGFTRVVNQYDDTTNLDKIQAWGEGLRDNLVSQYVISYAGREFPESATVAGTVDVVAVKAVGDARRDDAVNSLIYGTFGDLRDLTWPQRDVLLKAGITNIEIRGGERVLMDSVTLYHPVGVSNSIFAYDDSLCKIGNIAYDLRAYLDGSDWNSKILVGVDSNTTNPDAVDIDDIAATILGRASLWGKEAWIASVDFVRENSEFEIDGSNPRRVNINIKGQLTSTARLFDNTLFMGYLFGESA